MGKKSLVVLLVFCCFLISSTLILTPSAKAGPTTFTFSMFMPSTHPQSIASENMAKEIEKRSNGRVKIDFFPGATLTKPRVCYKGVESGISDLGFSCFAYTRGKFPVMEAVDLPLGYPNGRVATRVAWEYFKKMNPKELSGVKVLALSAHGPGILASKKDVNSLADIKGLKIRCTGLASKIGKCLNASPVAMPMNAAYEALQKGVVEATFCPIEVLKSWKQAEVIDYVIETKALGYTTAMFVVMNKKKFESLPPDIQKIFEQVGEEWIDVFGKAWDRGDIVGRQYVLDMGKKIHKLSPEQETKWLQAIDPIFNNYEVKAEKKGLPGKKAVELLRELVPKYSKVYQ